MNQDFNVILSKYSLRPKNTSWSQGLLSLLNDVSLDDIKMIEIGSYMGESTVIFASSPKVSKIYAVDPWLNGYDDKDIVSYQEPMESIEWVFDNITKGIDKIHKIKDTSESAIKYFSTLQDKINLIYIDGSHTYEGVKSDLINYCNFLKNDFYLCGHDISCPEVRKAVVEVVGNPHKTYEDDSWMIKL